MGDTDIQAESALLRWFAECNSSFTSGGTDNSRRRRAQSRISRPTWSHRTGAQRARRSPPLPGGGLAAASRAELRLRKSSTRRRRNQGAGKPAATSTYLGPTNEPPPRARRATLGLPPHAIEQQDETKLQCKSGCIQPPAHIPPPRRPIHRSHRSLRQLPCKRTPLSHARKCSNLHGDVHSRSHGKIGRIARHSLSSPSTLLTLYSSLELA